MSIGSDFGAAGGGYHSSSAASTRPIIVVPASATPGNICLGNAKGFLQDAQYAIATSSKPATGDQNKVLVERRIGD